MVHVLDCMSFAFFGHFIQQPEVNESVHFLSSSSLFFSPKCCIFLHTKPSCSIDIVFIKQKKRSCVSLFIYFNYFSSFSTPHFIPLPLLCLFSVFCVSRGLKFDRLLVVFENIHSLENYLPHKMRHVDRNLIVQYCHFVYNTSTWRIDTAREEQERERKQDRENLGFAKLQMLCLCWQCPRHTFGVNHIFFRRFFSPSFWNLSIFLLHFLSLYSSSNSLLPVFLCRIIYEEKSWKEVHFAGCTVLLQLSWLVLMN